MNRALVTLSRVAFRGWPAEAIEFFEGLAADNSRAYWQEHKRVYDDCVRAPMDALLAELAGEFGAAKVFRPNRDVRFSADKSPYKTNIAGTLAEGGYVALSAENFGVGTGMYMMAPDQLDRYRRAVDDDRSGQALERVVTDLRAAKIEVTGHEQLKSAPRGYAKDHPRIELLRWKGLVAWREWPVGAWLGTKAPATRVAETLRGAAPLNQWLDDHVGPSVA